MLDVHLRGAFHVVRPAFGPMCDAGYGRIVLTSSIGGLYGNHDVANYAAAKAGIIGLSNVAAIEGAARRSAVQCDRARRRDQNGRRHRHLLVPADGLRIWSRRRWGGWRTKPVRSAGRCWWRSPAGSPGPPSSRLPGVYRPSWSIEQVGADIGAIRDLGSPVEFPVLPDGHADHIRYSFGMAGATAGSRPWLARDRWPGVRVVDLTAMVMGPYCTQIMADMGADVIKVEPPEGDNTRFISVGPAPGMSGVFVNVNRGKRSVVLDLRTDAGKAALRALIARADVFIHSMRAKAIAKLGFDYDDGRRAQPARSSTPTATATAGAARSGTCPPTTTPSRPSAEYPRCRSS